MERRSKSEMLRFFNWFVQVSIDSASEFYSKPINLVDATTAYFRIGLISNLYWYLFLNAKDIVSDHYLIGPRYPYAGKKFMNCSWEQ